MSFMNNVYNDHNLLFEVYYAKGFIIIEFYKYNIYVLILIFICLL